MKDLNSKVLNIFSSMKLIIGKKKLYGENFRPNKVHMVQYTLLNQTYYMFLVPSSIPCAVALDDVVYTKDTILSHIPKKVELVTFSIHGNSIPSNQVYKHVTHTIKKTNFSTHVQKESICKTIEKNLSIYLNNDKDSNYVFKIPFHIIKNTEMEFKDNTLKFVLQNKKERKILNVIYKDNHIYTNDASYVLDTIVSIERDSKLPKPLSDEEEWNALVENAVRYMHDKLIESSKDDITLPIENLKKELLK